MDAPQTLEERVLEICSIQSISASIQNLLLAAVALGYPAESPASRPRKPLEEILRWRR